MQVELEAKAVVENTNHPSKAHDEEWHPLGCVYWRLMCPEGPRGSSPWQLELYLDGKESQALLRTVPSGHWPPGICLVYSRGCSCIKNHLLLRKTGAVQKQRPQDTVLTFVQNVITLLSESFLPPGIKDMYLVRGTFV